MPTVTEKGRIGALGEDIAVKYMGNRGFRIICRNYRKKCGEIDIVGEKAKILHFIEVKSVSREISAPILSNVSRGTVQYRPEDNIHAGKARRLARTIQLYLAEKYPGVDPDWQFGAITVKIDEARKIAAVKMIEDIVIGAF